MLAGYVADEAGLQELQRSAGCRCCGVVRLGQQVSTRKAFFFFATWFEVETAVYQWVGKGSGPGVADGCQDHSEPYRA